MAKENEKMSDLREERPEKILESRELRRLLFIHLKTMWKGGRTTQKRSSERLMSSEKMLGVRAVK